MDENGYAKRSNPGRKIIAITGGVFLVFYLILGILFLVVDKMPFDIPGRIKTAFGIILIAYACFRFGRIIAAARNRNRDD